MRSPLPHPPQDPLPPSPRDFAMSAMTCPRFCPFPPATTRILLLRLKPSACASITESISHCPPGRLGVVSGPFLSASLPAPPPHDTRPRGARDPAGSSSRPCTRFSQPALASKSYPRPHRPHRPYESSFLPSTLTPSPPGRPWCAGAGRSGRGPGVVACPRASRLLWRF